MMSNSWYSTVPADAPLTQGDLIEACPLLQWDAEAVTASQQLEKSVRAVAADVIVMTQACDLEHGKVDNVLLCPCDKMSVYREMWEKEQRARNQTPFNKSWGRHCDNIRDGYTWNLGLLDAAPDGEPVIVNFHEVYTVPRRFLESFLREQARSRLRLSSPYREHLSQAFARFFMRVGLPTQVTRAW